jgi:hypothetical protein
MRRLHRFALGILIPAGAGIGFAAVWIAATGTFRPPVWALITVSVVLGVLSYALETAAEHRRRPLPVSARRRAHARPTDTRKDTTTA